MANESVVYGCITDMIYLDDRVDINSRRSVNRGALAVLPSVEDWPLLCREMFSSPRQAVDFGACQTDVIHFGSSYKGVEHEWNNWIKQFEGLLDQMYWATATVHLQTAFSGSHTFVWQPEAGLHRPGEPGGHLRCEWIKEDSLS